MPSQLMPLEVRSRQQWRAWLRKHHASSPGVWLVCYKGHTGIRLIPYEAAVREALCFGWIDSLIKRLDDDRYARKFTPRQPTAKWSDINRARWAKPQAWRFFQKLAPSYRRHFVAWIHTTKRSETRDKRIRESVSLLVAGEKLGLK